MPTKLKMGRQPREYSPAICHLSSLLPKLKLTPLPTAVDWSHGMAKNLGMMLNDTLGDCTCAAVYHARQIWTYNAMKHTETDPDKDVLELYEKAAGYNPADPNTDQGATCQSILEYLYNTGAPTSSGTNDKILGFIEVDPRLQDDIKRTIYECGVAYIGINVPDYLMPEDGDPPALWHVENVHAPIIGGHCVVLCGYDHLGFDLISWGQRYKATPQFLHYYLDEVYGIIDKSWFDSRSVAPLGLSMHDIDQQMSAIAVSEQIRAA